MIFGIPDSQGISYDTFYIQLKREEKLFKHFSFKLSQKNPVYAYHHSSEWFFSFHKMLVANNIKY